MVTVRDHRKGADVHIPRGTYAAAKAASLGLTAPAAVPSLLQRVRSTTSDPRVGDGPVVRDHRQTQTSTKVLPRGRVLTGTFTGDDRRPSDSTTAGAATQQSTVVGVEGQPEGFGISIAWVGEEDLAIVAFVSASHTFGVGISGATDGDTFELVSAVGNATFSQDTDNGGVAGIVTIVAAGAALTAAAFGAPELAPLITGAGNQIAKQFPEQKHNSMSRDVFGQISGSSDFARAEGGLLVCSPNALGIYQSGDADHKDRWIKSHDNRNDENRPNHVASGFFLQRDRQRRILDGDGDLIIAPWDHQFDDNVGAYRINFLLRRGDRPPIVIT